MSKRKQHAPAFKATVAGLARILWRAFSSLPLPFARRLWGYGWALLQNYGLRHDCPLPH